MQPGASLNGADDEARAASHVDDAPYRFRYDDARSGRRLLWWVVAAAIVVAVLAALYFYWPEPREAPKPAPAEPPRAAVEPPPQPQAEQPIQHPIEAAKPEVVAAPEPAAPLPALDVSDQPVVDALAGVLGRAAIDEYLVPAGLVRRVVVTVDNLTRKKAPQRMWPVKPTPDRFLTSGAGDPVTISPDNARRYEPFLKAMESVDTARLAALYVRFYPLFQQAYRELGYPKGYFNDRLVEVIDHLLVTPEIEGPIRLAKPWIMYEFADPALEARSAGQKTLIRMGAANQQRVKAKLREFRRQIAGKPLKQ
jgi:hypothetical protein